MSRWRFRQLLRRRSGLPCGSLPKKFAQAKSWIASRATPPPVRERIVSTSAIDLEFTLDRTGSDSDGSAILVVDCGDETDVASVVARVALRLDQAGDSGHADVPRAFLLVRLQYASDELISWLAARPDIGLVHVCDPQRIPLSITNPIDDPQAVALAALATCGIEIPVWLSVGDQGASRFREQCRAWSIVNRGAGIIIDGEPEAMPANEFADLLIEVHHHDHLPMQKVLPLALFTSALGGVASRLPPIAKLRKSHLHPADAGEQCPWGRLCARWSDNVAGRHPLQWSCRVADRVIRRLLDSLLIERNEGDWGENATGQRTRAMMREGRMVFLREPIRKEMQMAPDPAKPEHWTDEHTLQGAESQ